MEDTLGPWARLRAQWDFNAIGYCAGSISSLVFFDTSEKYLVSSRGNTPKQKSFVSENFGCDQRKLLGKILARWPRKLPKELCRQRGR